MKGVIRVLILLVAFGLVTLFVGWWTVPVLGGLWGVVSGRDTWPAFTAALAGGLSWAVLLAWMAVRGPVVDLAHQVGGVMSLPTWALFVITVAFPMVLAGSAAGLTGAIKLPRKK